MFLPKLILIHAHHNVPPSRTGSGPGTPKIVALVMLQNNLQLQCVHRTAQHSISLTGLVIVGKEAYEPSARFSEVRTATLRSCVHTCEQYI